MIICVCNRVSEDQVRIAAAQGATLEDLQIDLGVGMQCGSCTYFIQEILSEAAASKE